MGRINGYHAAPDGEPGIPAARRAMGRIDARRIVAGVQRRSPCRTGLYRQGRDDRVLRLRQRRPGGSRPLRRHLRPTSLHPRDRRREAGGAARRNGDGSSSGTRDCAGCTPRRRQRPAHGAGRRRLREDQQDVRGGRSSVPRRGVEPVDRVGLREAFTAADLAPVQAALAAAQRHGTSAFDASGDTAGLECKGGESWSAPPGPG